MMQRLLVIEDGDEYEEFATLFLSKEFKILAAHHADEALTTLSQHDIHALLVDLRFERAQAADLVGDIDATAKRLFAGDREKATRWLKEQQGCFILGKLREADHQQRAVFVHDFSSRRLTNLRKLYGDVHAVPTFDANAIRKALKGAS